MFCQTMLRNQNDTEITFVSTFAECTEKLSRGGLRTASDDFLLLRELEMVCRKKVNEKDLSTNITFYKIVMKEKMMVNHTI